MTLKKLEIERENWLCERLWTYNKTKDGMKQLVIVCVIVEHHIKCPVYCRNILMGKNRKKKSWICKGLEIHTL
jgi:hypothetical protein